MGAMYRYIMLHDESPKGDLLSLKEELKHIDPLVKEMEKVRRQMIRLARKYFKLLKAP